MIHSLGSQEKTFTNILMRVLVFSSLLCGLISRATAEQFELYNQSDSVVGEVLTVSARKSDTLVDIAREFNLGYDQIIKANPELNRWIPGQGSKVILPHLYILPGAARKGLVLNIAELRLYYYPPSINKSEASTLVYSFPVSIGRMDWKTPLGITKVVAKEKNPAWRPPKSIREEHAREGEILPDIIEGGAPDNPLGLFALRLGFPGYLIHGVDQRKAYGIGMRVTHGCIRMYPDDIEKLFPMTAVNTPVLIMNEPIKIGRLGQKVFLSVHQPLIEGEDEDAPEEARVSFEEVKDFLYVKLGTDLQLDDNLIESMVESGDGIPREIASVSTEAEQCWEIDCSQKKKPKSQLDIEYEKAIAKYQGKKQQ